MTAWSIRRQDEDCSGKGDGYEGEDERKGGQDGQDDDSSRCSRSWGVFRRGFSYFGGNVIRIIDGGRGIALLSGGGEERSGLGGHDRRRRRRV